MADGDRQGIGSIGWFGQLRQIQEPRYHELNLLLLCQPVTHHARLYAQRRVFSDLQAPIGGSQQRHTSNLAQLQCGFGID